MPRYHRRRVYSGARDKYSVEHSAFAGTVNGGATSSIDVVPATTVQGMRKVKHLTISASVSSAMYWALMYIPQGMPVPSMTVGTGDSLVEPNQFVMNCGVLDPDAGPQRVSSRVARNLNSGDRIVLLIYLNGTGQGSINGVVNYAVTLQ